MTGSDALIPNRLREKRLQAGITSAAELAARAGIDPAWYRHIEDGRVLPSASQLITLAEELGGLPVEDLYALAHRSVIPGLMKQSGLMKRGYEPSTMYREWSDQAHVLVARDELTWFDRRPRPSVPTDVFMNLACGTQRAPHLLLDTVAVLDRLGVDHVAAAGSTACCGKPFINVGEEATAERIAQRRLVRSQRWGARVHVNWCTACQLTVTTAAARRHHAEGTRHPVREVQVLTFLEERLRELGDRVPWTTPVRRRVLVEGHPGFANVMRDARAAAGRLLALVPGVEVVGLYDGSSDLSPCTGHGRGAGWTPPPWYSEQDTAAGVRRHRARLVDLARAHGADTVSCQHQACHMLWSRYAGDELSVRHAVSIVAEALGCAHPDRHQLAVRMGDPEEFVTRSREVWRSWGMTEERALELAKDLVRPAFADLDGSSGCGADGCGGCQAHRRP